MKDSLTRLLDHPRAPAILAAGAALAWCGALLLGAQAAGLERRLAAAQASAATPAQPPPAPSASAAAPASGDAAGAAADLGRLMGAVRSAARARQVTLESVASHEAPAGTGAAMPELVFALKGRYPAVKAVLAEVAQPGGAAVLSALDLRRLPDDTGIEALVRFTPVAAPLPQR